MEVRSGLTQALCQVDARVQVCAVHFMGSVILLQARQHRRHPWLKEGEVLVCFTVTTKLPNGGNKM